MTDKDRINGLLQVQSEINQRITGEIREILRGNPHKMAEFEDTLHYAIKERFYFLIKDEEEN